jgi:hypothetical protein
VVVVVVVLVVVVGEEVPVVVLLMVLAVRVEVIGDAQRADPSDGGLCKHSRR